jgi:hypothetical protein
LRAIDVPELLYRELARDIRQDSPSVLEIGVGRLAMNSRGLAQNMGSICPIRHQSVYGDLA